MKVAVGREGWAIAHADHAEIPLSVAVDADGALAEICFMDPDVQDVQDMAKIDPATAQVSDPSDAALAGMQRVLSQLREYFAGERRVFDLRLRALGTDFQRRAWQALVAIPYGETRTYGQQAAALGSPNASRAVGRANSLNPLPIVVPCHRVIGSNGQLTGFAGGLQRKRWLLEHEGAHGGEQLNLLATPHHNGPKIDEART